MANSVTGTPAGPQPTALDEHLERLGTDQASLLESVNDAVGLRSGDVVLAVGSLAEGLGNRKSDLDLLLVTGDDDSQRAQKEHCWAIGRRVVDLRVLHAATIGQLTGRLNQWARLPWNLAEQAPFSYDERVLLHRLLDGLEVYPVRPYHVDYPWRPRRPDLARLKLKVARHMARTIQVDMVGYRDECDYATLVFAAQDLLGHCVDGLLAGHYLTNPNPKWRSRLLQRLPLDWEQSLRTRPTGLRADRVFWNLHRAPPDPERDSAISHALRCLAFARAAFAWAEERLLQYGGGDGSPGTRAREQSPGNGPPLPSLEFDVDFFFSDTGVAVARLNEFEPALRLSAREFALLLLFDGQTPAAEAQAVANDARDDGSAPLDVDEMVGRVTRSGLCLPPGPAPAPGEP